MHAALTKLHSKFNFLCRCIDERQYDAITTMLPCVVDPAAQLEGERSRLLQTLSDFAPLDITHKTTIPMLERIANGCEPLSETSQLQCIFVFALSPPVREWVWSRFVMNHIRSKQDIDKLQPWDFFTVIQILSPWSGVFYVNTETYNTAELRRMVCSETCDVCLRSVLERVEDAMEQIANQTWDHRNPKKNALCGTGDSVLCMSCFARISECPVCKKLPFQFTVTNCMAFPNEIPSENERDAKDYEMYRYDEQLVCLLQGL